MDKGRRISRIAFYTFVVSHYALLMFAWTSHAFHPNPLAHWVAWGLAAIAIAIFVMFRPFSHP